MQGGEDDLDALLKQFELKDKKSKEIVVLSNAEPPLPRLFASFTPVPSAVLIPASTLIILSRLCNDFQYVLGTIC